MYISSVLREKGNTIVSVQPDTPVVHIVSTIAARRIGAVLVLDADGVLAGIVSERDIVKALARKGSAVETMTAADIMTANVKTVTPDTTLNEAMEIMDRGYFRHLPVLENGELLGIISVRDVVRAKIDRTEQEVNSMRTYIHARV